MLLVFALAVDLNLSAIDGIILLTTLVIYLVWLTLLAVRGRNKSDLMLKEIG